MNQCNHGNLTGCFWCPQSIQDHQNWWPTDQRRHQQTHDTIDRCPCDHFDHQRRRHTWTYQNCCSWYKIHSFIGGHELGEANLPWSIPSICKQWHKDLWERSCWAQSKHQRIWNLHGLWSMGSPSHCECGQRRMDLWEAQWRHWLPSRSTFGTTQAPQKCRRQLGRHGNHQPQHQNSRTMGRRQGPV